MILVHVLSTSNMKTVNDLETIFWNCFQEESLILTPESLFFLSTSALLNLSLQLYNWVSVLAVILPARGALANMHLKDSFSEP